jgi:DNA-binding CsgD family transcriptional regulator
LLTVLHGGGEEEPLWSTFLVRLRRRFRADAARLVVAPEIGGEAVQIVSEPESSHPRRMPAVGDRLVEAVMAAGLRSQRVYGLGELAERDSFVSLVGTVPNGITLRLAEGRLSVLLLLTRSDAFAAGERAVIAALIPHLTIALANHKVREQARRREHLLGAVISRLRYGWVTLAPEGRILDCDPRAAVLIREGNLLASGPAGELLTASAAANRMILEALDQFGRGDPVSMAVRVSDAPRLDLLLKGLAAGETTGAILVAYLQEEGQEASEDSAALAALHGLAPREARLALALAEGDGIPEAAERLGLTVETARNYSKSVYAKIGVRGQAQLARTIAHSLAGLG